MGEHELDREPDYRFTLANERTLLAWIRTALALDMAGFVVAVVAAEELGAKIVGLFLLAMGTATSALGLRHWGSVQRAMRRGAPLPWPSWLTSLGFIVAVASMAVAVLVMLGRG